MSRQNIIIVGPLSAVALLIGAGVWAFSTGVLTARVVILEPAAQ